MISPRGRAWALITLLVWSFSLGTAWADIRITFGGSVLQTATPGQALPQGALLQLVNLGADGVFNPIRLNDGGSQWVSGDDTLVSVAFTVNGAAGDFNSAGAFDLEFNTDTQAGFARRDFTFSTGTLAVGAKLGLRWFASYTAAGFASLSGPAPGAAYGEYTRLSVALNGGDLWLVPVEGSTANFDPLLTASAGGQDAELDGVARLQVIPEPSALLLGLSLASLALGTRRWRARLA